MVFAKAERGKTEINAEEMRLGELGRGGIRYKAVLVALELLLP